MTRFVAALAAGPGADTHALEESAAAAFVAGVDAVLLPAGVTAAVSARILGAAGADMRIYHTVNSAADLVAARAVGSRAFRLLSAAAANASLLDQLMADDEVLVPVGRLASADISALTARHQRAGFVLLCDAPSRPGRELVPFAFMRWLMTLGCPVAFASGDHSPDVVGAAALMGAALVEVRSGVGGMPPAALRRLVSDVRRAEAVVAGQGEHRTPDDADALDELRPSLVAARAIPRGTLIDEAMVGFRLPLVGLGPECMPAVVGRQALYDLAEGDLITFGVISA